MTLSAKINEREFNDARKVFWQPYYQLNRVNNYAFHRLGIFRLMACVLAATIAWEYLADHFGTLGRVVAAIVVLVIVVALALHFRSPDAKLLNKFNTSLPDWIDVDENSLTCRADDGASVTFPWSRADQWRQTETVIVIQFSPSEPVVLPLTSLSEAKRATVIDTVRRKLGPPKFQG